VGPDAEGLREVPARWLNRPFAATFDLILSEYAGYTDETILDLTLGRIHQMRSVILERRKEEHQRDLEVEEVKLQHICSAVHGAAGFKDGVKAASKIQLYEREKRIIIPSMAEVTRMFGV